MPERLIEARDRARAFQRAADKVEKLGDEASVLRARVKELAERLAREQNDVDRLEQLSFSAMWHALRGDKVEKLAHERGELVAAQLEHDQTGAQLAETEKRRGAAALELERLQAAPQTYEKLLAEWERSLDRAGGPVAERLRETAREADVVRDALRQIVEARAAAGEVLRAMVEVEADLDSARTWGGLDMIGGGFITTAIKQSRVNAARASLARAQVGIRALQRELTDVGEYPTFAVDIGGFATFADYMFDGLLVDWFVQSRINEAREGVSAVLTDVQRVAVDLRVRQQDAEEGLRNLDGKRRELLERAAMG